MVDRLVTSGIQQVTEELAVAHPWWQWSASFNVAVSHRLPVARMHGAESEGVTMRWGLLLGNDGKPPARSGPASIPSDSLPGTGELRDAWLSGQRGIAPICGFYVWQRTGSGFRQPYYVHLTDRPVFGIAVLWQQCTTSEDDVIESCALLTVASNQLLLELDNSSARMPLILRRQDYERWLGANVGSAKELLQPYPAEQMTSHTVGPYVNHLSFDGPHLIRAAPRFVPV